MFLVSKDIAEVFCRRVPHLQMRCADGKIMAAVHDFSSLGCIVKESETAGRREVRLIVLDLLALAALARPRCSRLADLGVGEAERQ